MDPPALDGYLRRSARSAGWRFSGPLSDELRHRIRTTGPMPFQSYMRLALYHPTDRYYATRVPGHGADYRTSPSISPWFGRLIGRVLRRMWDDLGRPDPFWVIEVGAGLGDLAAGATEAAGPMAGALRWRFVEVLGPLSAAALDAASRGAAACLEADSRFEVCLELDGGSPGPRGRWTSVPCWSSTTGISSTACGWASRTAR